MPARSEFNRGLHFSIRLYASLSYRYPTLRHFAAAPPPPSSLASDTVIVWPPTDIAMFSPMKIAFCADSASAKTIETLGGRSCERSVSKPPSHKHRQRERERERERERRAKQHRASVSKRCEHSYGCSSSTCSSYSPIAGPSLLCRLLLYACTRSATHRSCESAAGPCPRSLDLTACHANPNATTKRSLCLTS